MKRVNVHLHEKHIAGLAAFSRDSGFTVAELIRAAIDISIVTLPQFHPARLAYEEAANPFRDTDKRKKGGK